MKSLYFTVLVASLLCVIVPSIVLEVDGQTRYFPCRLSTSVEKIPITYNEAKRQNPPSVFHPNDSAKTTYYQGDAFHYILYYSGGSNCRSPPDITSLISGGAANILSHENYGRGNQHHVHWEYEPKKFYVSHWYKSWEEEVDCYQGQGGEVCTTAMIYAKKPLYHTRNAGAPSSLSSFDYLEKIYRSERSDKWRVIPDDLGRDGLKGKFNCVPKWAHLGAGKPNQDCRSKSTVVWDWGLKYPNHRHNAHPYEDASSTAAFEKRLSEKCSGISRDAGCIYGHIELDVHPMSIKSPYCLNEELRRLNKEYPRGQENPCIENHHELTLTVESESVRCAPLTGCKYTQHKAEPTVNAHILNPTPHITFQRPPIMDRDEHDSKNLDDTYYVWDYPALLVEPKLKHREVRNGTISFDVIRTVTPISEVFTDAFREGMGKITAIGSGIHIEEITPTDVATINGDRLDVFWPEFLNEQGWHTFTYDVIVHNIKDGNSRQISRVNDNSIDTFIADYTPIFSEFHFPYIILNTPGDTTYDKQHGVALHYLGSKGTGPEDDGEMHIDRRAKINKSTHEIHAKILSNKYDLESVVELRGGKGIKDIVDSVHPTILKSLERDTLGEDYTNPVVSTDTVAVFFQEGYGRIAFFFEGLKEEVSTVGIAEINTDNTLYSEKFGGYDETKLYRYPYQYPGASVASSINVTAITSEGTVDESIDIKVLFETNHDTGKTLHLSEYMESHIDNFEKKSKKIHASKNNRFSNPQAVTLPLEFADMYLGDMYGVVNNGTGTGMLIVPINLPAVKILSEISDVFGYDPEISEEDLSDITSDVTSRPPSPDESSDMDDVPNTTPVGRDNTRNIDRTTTDGGGEVSSASSDGPICIPDCVFVDIDDEVAFTQFGEEYSYSSPVSYNMTVFANGLNHTLPFTTYGFSGAINYTLNADSGNYLNSTVYKGDDVPTLHILSEDNFGAIDKITINGELYEGPCVTSCQLIVPHDAVVEATNIWGGTAIINMAEQEERTGPNKQREIAVAYVDATVPTITVLITVFAVVTIYFKVLRK